MSEPLARLFHETYKRIAPTFGYDTGQESAVKWDQAPDRYKRLMIAVADLIELEYFSGSKAADELPSEFWASSGYGHSTQKPFVDVTYNGRKLAQMPPETAIELAHNLLACAEASLSDAFLIEFFRDTIGVEMAQIGGLLLEFREFREKREERP